MKPHYSYISQSLIALCCCFLAGCGAEESETVIPAKEDETKPKAVTSAPSSSSSSSSSKPKPKPTPPGELKITPAHEKRAAEIKKRSGENIDAAEVAAAEKLKKAKDPVDEAIAKFQMDTRKLFNASKFEELEKLAAELRSTKALMEDGSWKLEHFYESLEIDSRDADSRWAQHEAMYKDWMAKFPQSVTAAGAHMGFLINYAWKARGSGYADTVTEEGWKLFGQRIQQAADAFSAAMKLTDKDPHLWCLAQTVGMAMSMDAANFDSLVDAAHKVEPTYYPIDTRRAYSLLPRWLGEEGDWEAFAKKTSERPDGLGKELYARIVMGKARYYQAMFRETKASWPMAQEGLKILREKYPKSLRLLSYHAYLALQVQDRKVAQPLFEEIGDQYVEGVWPSRESFAHYRNWALTGKW